MILLKGRKGFIGGLTWGETAGEFINTAEGFRTEGDMWRDWPEIDGVTDVE